MKPAISVENLGKCYRVSHESGRKGYRTLRESLTGLAAAPLRRLRNIGTDGASAEDFWALKDVSFDVKPGEVVGIIGRNGAGKSTLLKILSRITKPSSGHVAIHGRVGSLLEVGTGFHPELTGRENIYLNGSILGMRRAEIEKRFDEIVAFSEIEQFIDTPVKRYSSGMYVRLAFAVAAHLEPEILLVDEVLAVGDAMFQRRCLDRMSVLAREGRSLMIVTHNLDIVPRFCSRAILVDHGRIDQIGRVEDVIDRYVQHFSQDRSSGDLRLKHRRGNGKATFQAVRFLDGNGDATPVLRSGEDIICEFDVDSKVRLSNVALAVVIRTTQGARILTSWTEEVGYCASLESGNQTFRCHFREPRIRPGRKVVVELWMNDGEEIDYVEDACILDITEGVDPGISTRQDQGLMVCDYSWSRVKVR